MTVSYYAILFLVQERPLSTRSNLQYAITVAFVCHGVRVGIGKKGSFRKEVFQKDPFSRCSREFRSDPKMCHKSFLDKIIGRAVRLRV